MGKRLTLEERVTAVCREASLARRHFQVFRVYSDPESRGRLFPTMERYPDFVRLDEQAHRDLAILRATSLFDTKEHTTHLFDLLAEVKARGTSPGLVRDIEAAIMELEAAVKKVRIIRHHAIAHRSASLTYDGAFKLARMTVDELGQLVGSAEAVAIALARAVGLEPDSMASAAPDDLHRLFLHLQNMRLELEKPRARRRRNHV